MEIDHILHAMRAEHIPTAQAGLWSIHKKDINNDLIAPRHGKLVNLPAAVYTFLYRLTDDTLMRNPPGETVMEDTPFELRTHLEFVLKARGSVLITGLGLGCVIRGLLCNPAVTSVTCIENSKEVLSMVQPYMPQDRLEIVEADALEWTAKNRTVFDFAWHDLWTNRSAGEPFLDLWHVHMMRNLKKTVRNQGAWAFTRTAKEKLIRSGFPWVG